MARARAVRSAAGLARLDAVRRQYHHASFIKGDPLAFVYDYADARDRELAGLVASGLAYGNVRVIERSVRRVLEALGPSPAGWLAGAADRDLAARLKGFRHRWTTGAEVVSLLSAVRDVTRGSGTLGGLWASLEVAGAPDVRPTLRRWYDELVRAGLGRDNSLLANPHRGSACKRLHLYLRWMIRRDEVDPGCWAGAQPALLLVPVDVHMHRVGRLLGFTRRRAADERTVLEITAGFRTVRPGDPAGLDFALTRLGIVEGLSEAELRKRLGGARP